jgi:hypothetical protein
LAIEDLTDLGAVPLLLALGEAHVEVEPVDAHVEDVEGAHRRPRVLGGERERGDLLALHVRHHGVQLVEGRRRGPAVLLEHRLAVEDRPRVVADRHEVLLAVRGGGGLEGVAEPVDGPHVADVGDLLGLGELRHAVPGEPGEHVVGRALEVGVDALLEGVVVDRVGRDLDAFLLRVGVGHRLEPLVRRAGALGLVHPERDVLGLGTATARAGRAVVTARRERAGYTEQGTDTDGAAEQAPAVDAADG